jgi:hypothetical protein
MATETLIQIGTVQSLKFPGIPPFTQISLLRWYQHALSKLRNDPDELDVSFPHPKTLGCFHLDLRWDKDGEYLLDDVEKLFGLMLALYNLVTDELKSIAIRTLQAT